MKSIAKEQRQSNFELLRIVCMILILFYHIMWHGGISYPNDLLSFNRFFQAFAYIWGKVAVNVFVMTSGYFLCTKDNFEIKRIIPLVAKAFTFVIIGLIIGYYVLHIEIENTQILLKKHLSGNIWKMVVF